MTPKVVYDKKNCDGFFICSAQAPELFEELDEENKVDLIDGDEISEDLFEREIGEELEDAAIAAADGCPVDVIKVLDDDGNLLEGPEELPIEA